MSKLLLVGAHFYPDLGGAERYIYEVAVRLSRTHGHQVTVLSTGPHRNTVESRVGEVRVVRLPTWFSVSAAPVAGTWPWQWRRLLAAVDPDVINTHSPQPGLTDLCAATRGGRPLIATYHSGTMKKGAWVDPILGAYEATVLTRGLRRAQAVVVTGDAVSRESFIPATGATYIPPGVDTDLLRPDPERPREPALLLYVGRIDRASSWKGIGTLLLALTRIAARVPDVRLRLAGTGDAVAQYRQEAASLGIAERVEFVGRLDGPALVDAYRQASVLVLPSITDAESFGMVLIEALACDTPVVGTDAGGIPAVISDTGGGVVARAGDADSLAEAVVGLLEDPARARRLGAAGGERVRSRYTWDHAAKAYDELIGRVVEEAARGR